MTRGIRARIIEEPHRIQTVLGAVVADSKSAANLSFPSRRATVGMHQLYDGAWRNGPSPFRAISFLESQALGESEVVAGRGD